MAFTITHRERTILILTMVLGTFALVYYFGLENALTALTDEREQLRQETETHKSYVQDLRNRENVDTDYREIERAYSITDQGSKEFTAAVEQNFAAIGMTGAQYRPPEKDLMEGNEDLGYVKLTIVCEGDIQRVTRMLNFFDQQAILVEDLKLTSYLDSPRINIEVTISQIVKINPEEREELRKKRATRGGVRTSREREPMGL